MKKYLLTCLASLIIVPVATNLVSNYQTVDKQDNFMKILKSNKLKSALQQSDNSGYDWNNIQNSMTKDVQSDWMKNHFSSSEINGINTNSQAKITNLNSSNSTRQDAFQSFLQASPQFKDIYENNQDAFTKVKEKIDAQYFSLQKVDLKLDASNTYTDAINNLNIAINSIYPSSNVVVSLADSSLAHKYLFDDSSSAKLLNFINNNISIAVNVQFGNDKVESKTVKLTNILIDPKTEDSWLYESINTYFGKENPQDLNLTATDNRVDALNKMIDIINQRFNINITTSPNNSGISVAFVNPGAAKDNFMQSENILDVMNQNMYFDVNITDSNDAVNKTEKQSLYLTNINFNSDNMKQVINSLWLQNSANSPINLGLMSNQTYGEVVTAFNQRLAHLDQKDHFQIQLTDSSLQNVKIDAQYNPKNPVFKANVQFTYMENNQQQIVGTSDIYLSNVKLSADDAKLTVKYDKLMNLQSELDKVETTLTAISLVASVLAITSVFYEPLQSSFLSYFALISSVAALGLAGYLAAIGEAVSSQDLIADVFSVVSIAVSAIIILLTTYIVTAQGDAEVMAIADTFFGVVSLVSGIVADSKDWIGL